MIKSPPLVKVVNGFSHMVSEFKNYVRKHIMLLAILHQEFHEMEEILTNDSTWKQTLVDVGIITAEEA